MCGRCPGKMPGPSSATSIRASPPSMATAISIRPRCPRASRRILAERSESYRQLHGIGLNRHCARSLDKREDGVLRGGQGLHLVDHAADQQGQIERLPLQVGRSREQPQIGNHLVDPHGLGIHQCQVAAALGVRLVAHKELCPAGNDRQRVVDLVTCPGGKLGQRGELLGLDRLAKRPLQKREPRQSRGQRTEPSSRLMAGGPTGGEVQAALEMPGATASLPAT